MQKYTNIQKYLTITFVICGLGICTGCSKAEEPSQTGSNANTADQYPDNSQAADSNPTERGKASQEIPDLTESGKSFQVPSASESENTNQIATASEDESSLVDSPEQPDDVSTEDSLTDRKLTPAELQTYTEIIQDFSNYGFLMSDWDKPTDINLYEVFYSGAGISRDGTEAEIQAFLKRNGRDELYTDFFVMDKTAVSSLLQEKIGLTYDEFVMKGSKGMVEAYYAESDSFCMEVGDTNYCLFECTEGVENAEGNIVTLHYVGPYSWIEEGEVQMWKDGSSIRYNHILKGDILDTTE